MIALDAVDRRLLDEHQRGFPICETSFAEIANRLDCEASEVIRRLARLKRRGMVSRVGPVFTPGRIGASTLAAMAVPPGRLESVAEYVNRYPAVNHNYEREHAINLWFVLTAPTLEGLDETLTDIRRCTGLDVLDLRLERAYHIDLGFPLWRTPSGLRRTPATSLSPRIGSTAGAGPATSVDSASASGTANAAGMAPNALPVTLDSLDRCLVGAIQDGLPLITRPYAAVAQRIGRSEVQVIQRLGRLLSNGVIKRMGVVVRHHELGYRANAMVVFDAPEDRVDALGARLAQVAPVTLCYRRTRCLPTWPFNLYCMLHGRDRSEVKEWVDRLLPAAVGDLDRAVLFSRRRFRQRGARYAPDCAHTEAQAQPRVPVRAHG